MATFALIHGAGSDGWYWHLVEPDLRAAGHETIAVDLPCDDDSAGLEDYVGVIREMVERFLAGESSRFLAADFQERPMSEHRRQSSQRAECALARRKPWSRSRCSSQDLPAATRASPRRVKPVGRSPISLM